MKLRNVLFAAILMLTIMALPRISNSQNVEVVGQAKITVMTTDNTADQLVVKQADGTLAVRDASTLSLENTGNYGTVVNPITGKVWLDRNLGASQVATSSTDVASYGDLYQWGRGVDGHQVRTSATFSGQALTWFADEGRNGWDGKFITVASNWLSTGETDLWSGSAAENNPCPSGYRLPTNAEWNQERLTWSSNDAAGAFASPLKLPLAGLRVPYNGSLLLDGAKGLYWSSTVSGSNARYILFDSGAVMNTEARASGFSVRCLKD